MSGILKFSSKVLYLRIIGQSFTIGLLLCDMTKSNCFDNVINVALK